MHYNLKGTFQHFNGATYLQNANNIIRSQFYCFGCLNSLGGYELQKFRQLNMATDSQSPLTAIAPRAPELTQMAQWALHSTNLVDISGGVAYIYVYMDIFIYICIHTHNSAHIDVCL